MSITARFAFCAALGASAAVMLTGAPVASAIPPNCTAADLATVSAEVSTASAAYLFDRPDVNDFLTGLRDDTDEQAASALEGYLEANPDVREQLRGIRQPLADMKARCGAADDTP